ncbi:MAG TPA: hypothetical protein PLB59_12460 [Bacteroidales bacterium]|nr:hypothetical protein [Paludibacteraceae bacterium]HNZ44094.1 hypothetical protein [Bacteroidales bacterium]HPB26451.1 hypothetical protein [Bacteroidales bacterium]HPI30454.1 hypothetical protein [Bacteroidales bacterium]HQN17213.1 hypothetical protein [Bacteroidales bacterium]
MYNLKSILYKKFRADSAEVLILLQKTMLAGNFSPQHTHYSREAVDGWFTALGCSSRVNCIWSRGGRRNSIGKGKILSGLELAKLMPTKGAERGTSADLQTSGPKPETYHHYYAGTIKEKR